MKGKGWWIVPFVLGMLLQMFIFFISNDNIKHCNEEILEKQLDSLVTEYIDLKDSIDILIENSNRDIIHDTIYIIKTYEQKVKNINTMRIDSVIILALEGTESL